MNQDQRYGGCQPYNLRITTVEACIFLSPYADRKCEGTYTLVRRVQAPQEPGGLYIFLPCTLGSIKMTLKLISSIIACLILLLLRRKPSLVNTE